MNDRDYRAMVGDYVLETLEADERADFERRLAADPTLQEEVRAYHELVAEIGEQTAPRRTPPSHLRGRVLAEARESGGGGDGSEGRASGGSAPGSGGVGPSTRTPAPRAPWLLAAACLALSVATGVAYQRSRTTADALGRAGSALERDLADLRDELAARDSLLETFLGPDVRTAVLASTGAQPSVRLFWNTATSAVVVAAFDLPPAPSGRTYQLWGILTGADPVSLGTFQTAANGRAIVRRDVPSGLAFEVGAVTEEPEGGSPAPTSAPFLVGSWTGGS